MAKRVRPARHYQRDDEPVLRLSRSAMRSVARELRHAFTNLSSMVPRGEVIEALKTGRNPAHVINFHHYREVLRGAFDRLGRLRAAGGQLGARKINGLFAAKRRKVRFHKRLTGNMEFGGLATKAQAGYRRAKRDERCGVCAMFIADQRGSQGTCTAVEGAIHFDDVCDFYTPAFPTIEKLQWLTLRKAVLYDKATGDQFTFDSFSPDIQDQIRQAQDTFIQQLESDARDTINEIISNGVSDGLGFEEIADNIRGMIGLTDTQAQAVLNYQNMLQELDPTALERQLRNTEYDAAIQDAIDGGTSLADATIEQMVSDYEDNYLDYRAATIAATESTRAANLGLHDAYSQAIDRGALSEDSITRMWLLGDNPCPICESIVDNNPDGVGVNESFDSDDGPIDDPPVHPNCECSVDYVTDLSKVPDDTEEYIGAGAFGPGGVNTPYMEEES